MRIVAGRWAGRDLVSPGGRVRPTTKALRGELLDTLANEVVDARVLDLFAGSGALGLEALSRGARACDFVENGAAALHALKANVAGLRARESCRIFRQDAIPFVNGLEAGAYDVAFADPPYGSLKLDRVLERWRAAPFAAILAIEHAPGVVLPVRGQSGRAGESAFTILRARRVTPPGTATTAR